MRGAREPKTKPVKAAGSHQPRKADCDAHVRERLLGHIIEKTRVFNTAPHWHKRPRYVVMPVKLEDLMKPSLGIVRASHPDAEDRMVVIDRCLEDLVQRGLVQLNSSRGEVVLCTAEPIALHPRKAAKQLLAA